MTTDTNPNLKEARHHGTNAFPCGTYHTVCQKRGMLVKHHWHEEIEIIHFINGHFRLIINMEVYEIKEECIFFIQPLELHAITIVSGNEATEDAIVFLPSMLSFDSYDHAQLHLIQPLINHELSFPRKLTPDHLAYSDILKTFSTIVSSFESYDHLEPQSVQTEDVSAQLTIKASLLTMLSILSKFTLFQKADITSDKRIDFIKAALLYIKEHYREKIYLSDLAELASMNEQYFCRFFKKTLGKTPTAYINEYRIRKAITLLETTNRSIVDISLDCGFYNLGNFLKAFRKYTQTTPHQYRKDMSK